MTNRSMSLFFIFMDCCSDIFLYKKRSGFLFNFRKDISLIKFILSPKNICFDLEKKKKKKERKKRYLKVSSQKHSSVQRETVTSPPVSCIANLQRPTYYISAK